MPSPGEVSREPVTLARTIRPLAVPFAAAVALGALGWWLGVQVGPGPTALNAGARYLLILGVAGFLLGLVGRDLSWTALAGLYTGQILALGVQVLRHGEPTGERLEWLPVFIVSVTLTAALGGVLGALARSAPSPRPSASA